MFAAGAFAQGSRQSADNLDTIRKDLDAAAAAAENYHYLLRSASAVVETAVKDRDLKDIEKSFKNLGFILKMIQDGDIDRIYRAVVMKSKFGTNSAADLELYIEFGATLKMSKTEPSRFIASYGRAGLHVKIDELYETVLRDRPFGRGTAIDFGLYCREVVAQAKRHPILDDVVISYNTISDRWLSTEEKGFCINYSFAAGRDANSLKSTVRVSIASRLDPRIFHNKKLQMPEDENRAPVDELYDMKYRGGFGAIRRPLNARWDGTRRLYNYFLGLNPMNFGARML